MKTRILSVALLAAALLVGPAGNAVNAASPPKPVIRTVALSLPAAPGVTAKHNLDFEPGLAVDGAGNFWTGSNITPFKDARDPRSTEAVSGADVWSYNPRTRTAHWVGAPFANPANHGPGLAGEDTDIAVAPAPNATKHYNIYAVSLWVGDETVAISQDGGDTWTLNPLGGVPVEDRPWIAADGACQFYLAYHQLPLFTPIVNKYDVCAPQSSGGGVAINPVQSTPIALSTFPGTSNSFGKVAVDNSPRSKFQHHVYLPEQECDPSDMSNYAPAGGKCAKVLNFVAVSSDGGTTYSTYPVALAPNGESQVWPGTVSTDAAGTVYFAWFDNHHAFLSTSRDGGKTWSRSAQVDPKVGAAVYPTVAAGGAGQVAISYYGTARTGDANSSATMGLPNSKNAAQWFLYIARSTNGGASFTTYRVGAMVHTGELCTQGSNCADANSRNLFDDMGAAMDPVTGNIGVAYTSDQPGGTTADGATWFAGVLLK